MNILIEHKNDDIVGWEGDDSLSSSKIFTSHDFYKKLSPINNESNQEEIKKNFSFNKNIEI